MSTNQRSPRRSCWCFRTISRRRRRTRLRTVALPRRRVVTKPARHSPAFCAASTPSNINFPRWAHPPCFTRSNSCARVNRRVFGKENKRAPRILILDLTMHNRTAAFCRTAKVFPRKQSREDSFAGKERAELWRWRRRRIYINVRLRLGLRGWRFFYDRRVAFRLLGWRVGHGRFFLFTCREQCDAS
jgi:hypothetical protein